MAKQQPCPVHDLEELNLIFSAIFRKSK